MWWLPIGPGSGAAIGSGEKTSAIVELGQTKWVRSIGPGVEFEWRATVWPRRKGEQARLASRSRVRVTRVCRHLDVEGIATCANGHEVARIRPNEPDWTVVLGAAATQGGKRPAVPGQDRPAASWVVVDFELIDFKAYELGAAPRVHRNAVERQLAQSQAELDHRRRRALTTGQALEPDLAERQHRLLNSAYTFRLAQVRAEGGDPASITMEDLDFAAAATRLERKDQEHAARAAAG